MSWENEFLLLYIYSYTKISFTTGDVFKKASPTQNSTALYFDLPGICVTLCKQRNT